MGPPADYPVMIRVSGYDVDKVKNIADEVAMKMRQDSNIYNVNFDWQEKAKTSQFYQNAINTWTIRDVKKQEYAKKYNLNYKIIY